MQRGRSFGAGSVHTTAHRRPRYVIPSGEKKVIADTGDNAGLLLARVYAVTDHKKTVLAVLLFISGCSMALGLVCFLSVCCDHT